MNRLVDLLQPEQLEYLNSWISMGKSTSELIDLLRQRYLSSMNEQTLLPLITEYLKHPLDTSNSSSNTSDKKVIDHEKFDVTSNGQQTFFGTDKNTEASVANSTKESKKSTKKGPKTSPTTQIKTDLDEIKCSLSHFHTEIESLKTENIKALKSINKEVQKKNEYLISIDELIEIHSSKRERTSINLNSKVKQAINKRTSKKANFSDVVNDLLLKALYKK